MIPGISEKLEMFPGEVRDQGHCCWSGEQIYRRPSSWLMGLSGAWAGERAASVRWEFCL